MSRYKAGYWLCCASIASEVAKFSPAAQIRLRIDRGFAAACFCAMELITILNRCHRFRGFVYQHAQFTPDYKSIEGSVRPRKGAATICSRCHQPAAGYDQLGERRSESIPLWGSSSSSCTPCGA